MSIYQWSRDPAANGSADPPADWPEGMAPSKVNDSARATMSRVAELLYDLGGLNTVAGTANALTVTPACTFPALASGIMLTIKPMLANTGAATLAVGMLGTRAIVKPSATAADADLDAGDLQAGGRYLLIYDAALRSGAGAWFMMGADSPHADVHIAHAGNVALDVRSTDGHIGVIAVRKPDNSDIAIRMQDDGTNTELGANHGSLTVRNYGADLWLAAANGILKLQTDRVQHYGATDTNEWWFENGGGNAVKFWNKNGGSIQFLFSDTGRQGGANENWTAYFNNTDLILRNILYLGNGSARVHADGNVWGSLWGGYIYDWLYNNFAARWDSNANSIGHPVLARQTSGSAKGYGSTIPGSQLLPSSVGLDVGGAINVGTWVTLGNALASGNASMTTNFKRFS